jgi:phosphate transport system substrate-binding protein
MPLPGKPRVLARLAAALPAAALLAAGCASAPPPTATPVPVALRIAADPSVLPAIRALTRAYSDRNPHVSFTVAPAVGRGAAEAALAGQADVAAVAELPRLPEAAGAWVGDVAMDGVAVIVHPSNPLAGLTSQQLRELFSGALSDWAGLGAPELGPVQVAIRESGDSSRELFDQAIMRDYSLSLDAMVAPSIEVMIAFVAYQPGAIGYLPASRITATVSPPVKVATVDGLAPSREAITRGAYSMSRLLRFVAAAEPQGELRRFVAWTLGEEGQRVVAAANYVSLPISPE